MAKLYVIECKNSKHGQKVLEALKNDGFKVDEK